ncbi:hypothetical protein F5B17DRAFT_411566 [Nemania serpens]|nr:hypothetical protein F5B17DRAFT_411566 [Nemania serpens]
MAPVVRLWLDTWREGHSVIEAAFSGVWTEILTLTAEFLTEGSGHYILLQCEEDPDVLIVLMGYDCKELGQKIGAAIDERVTSAMDYVSPTELLDMDLDITDLPLDSGKIAVVLSESEPAHLDSLPGRGIWAEPGPTILIPDEGFDPDKPRERKWVHIASSKDADDLKTLGTVRNFIPIMETHMNSQPA